MVRSRRNLGNKRHGETSQRVHQNQNVNNNSNSQNMIQRHQNHERNDDNSNSATYRANGEVKMKASAFDEPRTFPWTDCVGLLALTISFAVAVPFLAKSIPPVPRTDIVWWMNAVVFQFPPPQPGQHNYLQEVRGQLDDLQELGVTAVRLENVLRGTGDGPPSDYYELDTPYGDLADFQDFTLELRRRKLRLILDMSVAYTSTAHAWFVRDRKRNHGNNIFSWTQTPPEQRPNEMPFKDVVEFWLRLGADGFILQDYDAGSFLNNNEGALNHIETEPQSLQLIRKLVNQTASWRRFFDSFQDEDERELFFGVDVHSDNQELWQELYEAGVDMLINHDLELSGSDPDSFGSDLNAYHLRASVQKALARVPGGYWSNWKICNGRATMVTREHDNHKNLLNMMHLLLPGATFLCPGQLPEDNQAEATEAELSLFQDIVEWRSSCAMTWGDTHTSLVTKDIFSFVRYSFGKKYPRYLFIANVGDSPALAQNFTMKVEGLRIPEKAIVRYVTCPSNTNYLEVGDTFYLSAGDIQAKCGLLVELVLG